MDKKDIVHLLGSGDSITERTFDAIRELLPDGGRILELGSGDGTSALTEFYDVVSVEESFDWIGRCSKSRYIHAPLVDGWYDPKILAEQLPPRGGYDLVLVDGPRVVENPKARKGLLKHLGLFDISVPFVFDDVNREHDFDLAVQFATITRNDIQISVPQDIDVSEVMHQFAIVRPRSCSEPRLAICYPWTSPFMYSDCVESMLKLKHPEGWKINFFRGTGWSPARRHNQSIEQALEWGTDYICILGSDQIYEPDLLTRLCKRVMVDGCEVISAMVPARCKLSHPDHHSFQPTAWRIKEFDALDHGIKAMSNSSSCNDTYRIIDPKDGDLQRVDTIGSGVLMFQRDHLFSIKRPWFRDTVANYEMWERIANMDTGFVHRLRTEAHADVWVDTSIKVKHLHIFAINEGFHERLGVPNVPTPGTTGSHSEEPGPVADEVLQAV